MLQLVTTNMLYPDKKWHQRWPDPTTLGKSMNSMRLDVKMYISFTQETSA